MSLYILTHFPISLALFLSLSMPRSRCQSLCDIAVPFPLSSCGRCGRAWRRAEGPGDQGC